MNRQIARNKTNAKFQPVLNAAGIYDPDTKLTRFGVRDYNPVIGQ